MKNLILIKYGELTTKKNNRNVFINKLENNIKQILKDYDIKIIKNRVRMYIECKDIDVQNIVLKLQNVFGIHSIVICERVNTNIDDIKSKVLDIIKQIDFKTFKVDTNRANKNFPIKSMDFNSIIGSLVLKNKDVKVDVHNPDIVLKIEIREDYTYLYHQEYLGSNGYPVGIQGKGLLLLSGGIDSPVAGYLSLKRGIDLECMYFESPPHTSVQALNKVLKLTDIINNYSGNIKLHVIPFTKIQETIYQNVSDNYMITILRRMMYRIAEKFCAKNGIKVIINGESVGQVASQTLDSMNVINNVVNIPVLRPLVCMDKSEIIDLSNKIGTYETSILPYEDCCTIFVPKHPVIHPTIVKAEYEESLFEFDSLIDEAINNVKTYTVFKEDFTDIL